MPTFSMFDRRGRVALVLAANLWAFGAGAGSQPQPAEGSLADRLTSLQDRLEKARVEHHVPGMSLAVVLNDRVILARGFGLRDIEGSLPADEHTKFAIGSSTKAFTSLLVGMMVDEGRMSWDEPVRTHEARFHLSDPEADAQVTIRDLLCHRSGLGRTDLLWMGGGASHDQMLAALAKAELAAPFRSAFNYNNIGFLTAGLAAASAAGSDWPTMIRDRIFVPLGMDSSDTSVAQMLKDPAASKGYTWDEDKDEFRAVPMRPIVTCEPAGAINSTALDMARWVRLQLGEGEFEGRRLVSEASLRETWTHQIDMAPGAGYGLGWMLHEWNGTPVVEHGGNIDGFAAQVAMLPERHAGFVLLTNTSYTTLTVEAQNLVWEALFPTPQDASAVMTEAQMTPYTGKFRFDQMGIDVTVLVKDGKLCCDVPGQTVYELKWPDAEGKWVFALTDAIKVSFERAPDGSIPSLTMFQAGMEFTMPRIGADGSVAKGPQEPSPFTAEQLREFTGTYHFADAGQDWRVQIKDGRLAVDVPGQTAYTLKWPDAEGKWAFAMTDAIKVSFEKDGDGAVHQLTCYQGGMTIPMPKTAPGEDAAMPTVDEVMALRAAQSDPATFRALGAVRAVGTLRLVQQGVGASVNSLNDPDGRFKLDIDMGLFGSIRMGSDGDSAWSESLGQPWETVTGSAAAAMRREATAMFVKDLRKEFETVEVVRKDTIDGRPVIVLRARSADGERSTTEYVNPENGLPLREESVTTVPGVGPLPSSANFADYRDFEGLMIPTTITVESFGMGKAIMTIESVETHIAVGPGDFMFAPKGR